MGKSAGQLKVNLARTGLSLYRCFRCGTFYVPVRNDTAGELMREVMLMRVILLQSDNAPYLLTVSVTPVIFFIHRGCLNQPHVLSESLVRDQQPEVC